MAGLSMLGSKGAPPPAAAGEEGATLLLLSIACVVGVEVRGGKERGEPGASARGFTLALRGWVRVKLSSI